MQTSIKIAFWFLLLLSLLQTPVQAAEEFIIEDIRIEGLERITPGTVFNYLPVKVGDRFDDTLSGEAVRSLFQTGFFNDVRLERDGNVLVVVLEERPAIGSITVSGNKELKTEDLMTGLRQVGFAEGRIFDQSLLDKVEQELRRQYFSSANTRSRLTRQLMNSITIELVSILIFQRAGQHASRISILSATSLLIRMIW
ncbi:MAG: POTRA domain-containing protein [Gammaproteobacteria bacterium]|nr:POTRA domain-containing protein [Gammaproteobacteria bacterium]